MKRETALHLVRARVHARFHDALANGIGVAKAREMADGVKVHSRLLAFSNQLSARLAALLRT